MSSVFNINKYIREKIKFFNNKMKFLQKFEIVIFYFIISLISHNATTKLRKNEKLILEKQIIEKDNKLGIHSFNENVKNPILKKILTKTYRYSSLEAPKVEDEGDYKISKKIIKIASLYMQFFVILSILSFQKWFEDLIKIITFSVDQKFSKVNDLTSEKNKNLPLENFESEYIFTAGSTNVEIPAKDPIFDLQVSKKYASIYRIVEYYNPIEKAWYKLGHFDNRHDSASYDGMTPSIEDPIKDDKKTQLSINNNIFTFPNIRSAISAGHVTVTGITLSHQQLRRLTQYEKIEIPGDLKLEIETEGYRKCESEY
jgi:hypothetical protein